MFVELAECAEIAKHIADLECFFLEDLSISLVSLALLSVVRIGITLAEVDHDHKVKRKVEFNTQVTNKGGKNRQSHTSLQYT